MPRSWRTLCTIVSVVLLVAVLLVNQFGSPLACYAMERQVYSHLESLGYTAKHISDIQVVYDADDRYPYTAQVTFADHGGYVRCYCYNSNREIQLLERIGQ